ncbi:MAG: alpha/beta hydrolase [Thiotrichales bacterium]|nr:alpha/beta hydrolase [Thiotrichales bacterium]
MFLNSSLRLPTLTAALLGFSLLANPLQAAEIQEIKQPYQGLTVNANLMLADGKSYADSMVLITHGTLTHKGRSTYAQLQKNLAAQGVSSLAFNLSLGVNDRDGEYDCAVTHTHKHTDALQEIGFWANWLKEQGSQDVTLMGHSRGGNQAAWYASEQAAPNVQRLVLLAPATGEQQSASEYSAKAGKPLEPILKQAQQSVAEGKGDTLLQKTDFIYCKEATVSAAAFADYYTPKSQFDTPSLLKDAKLPTLVIMGSADTVVADLPAKIQPLAEAGKIQTVTLEDADHFFLDFANEDTASAIVEFIQ